jgi:HPt (histidine-containing phosphotransfer) domain-containing protein
MMELARMWQTHCGSVVVAKIATTEESVRAGGQYKTMASSHSREADTRVVDLSAIAELAASGDPKSNFACEVIDIFLTDARNRISAILANFDSGAIAAIANQGHALRGSCSHFGAQFLVLSCAKLETAVRAGQMDGLRDLIDATVMETERVCVALREYQRENCQVRANRSS